MRSSVKIVAMSCALWANYCFAHSNRKAVYLDFQAHPQPEVEVDRQTLANDPVQDAMMSSLVGAKLQDVTQETATRGLYIPSWMTGSALTRPAALLSTTPYSATCSVDPRPSARLNAAQEKRRQLLLPLVAKAACEAGLPVGLMDALIVQESRYNPLAISPKGAVGLTQLMRGTAQSLGANRYDLLGNLRGGATYLRQQLNEFKAPHLALAAYNAGPGRVRSAGGIPNIAETRNYVSRILSEWSGMVTPGAGVTGSHSRRVTLQRF